MNMKRNRIAVIGVGNTLLADEGAGIHALRLLRRNLNGDEVDLIEAGTPGMGLLHHLQERDKVIFVDSGRCGLQPGEFRRFLPQEAISRKPQMKFTLHDFDLVSMLQWVQENGIAESTELVVYCIQASKVQMSQRLSEAVRRSLSGLVETICREIREDTDHA